MRLGIFLLCGLCALAQVEAPSIGQMLDGFGQLRPVYGVAGNFVLGPPVLDSLPGPVSPELRLAQVVVFATESELVARRADASEVRFPLDGVIGLRAMSADWVQVIAGSRNYALRIESAREALFALPDAPRREVRRR